MVRCPELTVTKQGARRLQNSTIFTRSITQTYKDANDYQMNFVSPIFII